MKIYFGILCLLVQICFGQDELPKDYFQSPLDVPLVISGTFGELRSNHFHAGLDIKTQGVEGLEVRASAEGYVSQDKNSTFWLWQSFIHHSSQRLSNGLRPS